MKGTPKTLKEAITNGFGEANGKRCGENIENHIRDFLAQKFAVFYLKDTLRGAKNRR